MTLSITVVASEADLELLGAAAETSAEVALSTPEPLETSGDGLNFPVDPATAVDALKVVAAFVTTANGVRQLLQAWSDRRKASRLEDEIIISSISSGKVVYRGGVLSDEVVEKIRDLLAAEEPEDGGLER